MKLNLVLGNFLKYFSRIHHPACSMELYVVPAGACDATGVVGAIIACSELEGGATEDIFYLKNRKEPKITER